MFGFKIHHKFAIIKLRKKIVDITEENNILSEGKDE